jgi:acylphosphatase
VEKPKPAGAPSAFFAQARGRVQGVGFRYWAYNEANRFGLTGWIRNTRDGDVDIWAEGPRENLDLFFNRLRQGPPRARVDSVELEEKNPTGAYIVFSIE